MSFTPLTAFGRGHHEAQPQHLGLEMAGAHHAQPVQIASHSDCSCCRFDVDFKNLQNHFMRNSEILMILWVQGGKDRKVMESQGPLHLRCTEPCADLDGQHLWTLSVGFLAVDNAHVRVPYIPQPPLFDTSGNVGNAGLEKKTTSIDIIAAIALRSRWLVACVQDAHANTFNAPAKPAGLK